MGRHREIHVAPKKLLVAIARTIRADVAAADRRLAAARGSRRVVRVNGRPCCEETVLQAERRLAPWPRQDLERWAGRRLTPSQRIRHQEAVRQLEQDGLIDRDGRRVTLTPEGWQAVGLTPRARLGG